MSDHSDALIELLEAAAAKPYDVSKLQDRASLMQMAARELRRVREAPVETVREASFMDGYRVGKIIATTDAAMIGQRVRLVPEGEG